MWVACAVLLLVALAYAAWKVRDRIPLPWMIRASAAVGVLQVDHSIRMAMPDGVVLAASLYRPGRSSTPLPTLLIRLPYDRMTYEESLYAAFYFARNGYAVLVQDLRGKFGSQGLFAPWEKATQDGVATLDWIVGQSWSNGKVGSFGCSALGEVQYALARAGHPAHAAMVISGAGGAWGAAAPNLDQGGFHEGGILQLASAFGWSLEHGARDPTVARGSKPVDRSAALSTLPLVDMIARLRPGHNIFTDYLRMPPGDPAWRRLDLVQPNDRIDVPALVINTWGDQTLQGTLELAEMARRQGGADFRQRVVIAPGNHCNHNVIAATGEFGDLVLGNTARPYGQWALSWFNQALRGEGHGLDELPPYQFYVIGENRWLAASQWPPENVDLQHWLIGSDGRANSRSGNGVLSLSQEGRAAHDDVTSDPMHPVPTRGGPICCTGNPNDRSGPVDQTDVETRDDVLVYTSAPLQQPMRLAGPLRAHLTISSSAPDTDVVVKLVHVWPDGRATNIQEGALRMRYREGPLRAEAMTPDRRYRVEIPMRSIAYFIPAGHRLRVQIAGSSFPRLERNLNTGGNNFDEGAGQIARNRIHHGGADLSFVVLPVLDDQDARDAP